MNLTRFQPVAKLEATAVDEVAALQTMLAGKSQPR